MSHANHSLYILQIRQYIVIVIYVDDLIILATNVDMLNELKSSFEYKFRMSDIGEFHFFLDIHCERDRRSRIITMHHQNYIKNVLERFNMVDCKPIRMLGRPCCQSIWMKCTKNICTKWTMICTKSW